ncbi:MAG TPA: prolyl oligopeptidase family serine peptidase [Acidobacteriaceae bacterium]
MIRRIVVAVGICLLSLSAGAQSFTLQQVLSAPFSSALQASPAGGRFLWIANQQGKRNIWVAEASGSAYTAHRVTSDDADDGVDVGDITWTPDGEQIVYARGGDFEFPEKAAANPAMLPAGLEEDIWIVGAHGGDARKLAEGQAPAVSPDGATMAYLDKDQIWTLNLRDTAAKPAQLFHGRGRLGSLQWSPDGKWLAFTSGRGDHGFVGVFSFADQTLQYLDPSTEIDREPVWSPDSTQIAFVRIPPDTSGVDFKPRRSAQPWSLRVADVKTGAGHEIWRAHEGQGSVFHETETEAHQLYWSAGGHIVFPWEGSGWVHLYSVAASGGEATELTPGEFEVDYVAFSKDRKTLVYSSNQDDIDRRHLWEVSADGGSPRELTHGDGLEIVPAIAPDGTVAVLRSDVHVPIRPAVVGAGGTLKDLAPQMVPADFPGAKLLTPQQVIFSAADGMKIHGQLFVPGSAEDGKRHPALVFFHGGSRRQMLLGWHYMDYYSNAYGMNQYLASLGYVVLSVNYRSGIGYGLNFREALNYGAAGASEFNDVQGAGLYLRSRPDVDGAKIGVWGGSYGGYLTALALSRASDMFAAGVDFHGVHDWNLELENWQPKYDPDSDQQAERIAWESSPLASVKTWRSPVLLIQGDDDRNVQFSQTVRLAAALRAQGTPFEEHVFPDEIHGFLLERSWITAYGLTADFFNRKLKGQ